MFILGIRKIRAITTVKSIAFALFASLISALCLAQSEQASSANVTVQTDSSSLGSPPSVAAQLSAQDKPSKAAELFAPVTKVNTPKIYTKPTATGSTEMDLRQLWNEMKANNPQLSALRESYLSAKATVPQIGAPANPQVGLVWSGMPVNSPLALGGANTPSQQYPGGISSNNSISVTQAF